MVANCVLVIAAVGVPFAGSSARGRRKSAEKTYPVRLVSAEWADVFDWYAKLSALKGEIQTKPKGTLTLDVGKDRRFTSGEITDLLNEELAKQQLLLIPNRKTFAIVSADERIDPKLIPVVSFTDLATLPRTALVEVEIPLTSEVDEEGIPELKKLLTPLGKLLSAKGKSIVLRDTVQNVVRITKPF